jgi:hypothetical protein
MRFAIRLYPAAWRARYGEEFEALIEDLGPVGRDVWNVLGGALKTQLMTWSPWKLIPALAAAGAVAAGIVAVAIQPQYVSSAVAMIGAPGAGPASLSRPTPFTKEALSTIVVKEGLYPGEVRSKGLDYAVAKMQRAIRIAPGKAGKAPMLVLSFTYPDPAKARAVCGDLVHSLIRAVAQSKVAELPLLVAVVKGDHPGTYRSFRDVVERAQQILDGPSLPKSPIYPNRLALVVFGAGAGLFLALMVLLAQRLRHRRA